MRRINFSAGLGTVLLFIGFYCLKSAFKTQYKAMKEGPPQLVPLSQKNKWLLLFCGVTAIVAGGVLIVKELPL
jgi:uncharacterized membrane protein HdeD (DUF308 family)